MLNKTNSIYITLIILTCFLFLSSCQKESYEKQLFNYFKQENELTLKYSHNYLGYMKHQLNNFEKKQKSLNLLFNKINRHFDKLNQNDKINYQKKWQLIFQPIVDKIYDNTRHMILNQKQTNSDHTLAQIKELNIKLNLLEKNTPKNKLKPKLFLLPQEKD